MSKIRYIVAHPESMVFLENYTEALGRADCFRSARPIVIYEVREVGRVFAGPATPEPLRKA